MRIVIGQTKDDITGMIFWKRTGDLMQQVVPPLQKRLYSFSQFYNHAFLMTVLSLMKLLDRYKSNTSPFLRREKKNLRLYNHKSAEHKDTE